MTLGQVVQGRVGFMQRDDGCVFPSLPAQGSVWCRMYEAAVFQIILQVGQAVPIVGKRFLMQGLGSVCLTLIDLFCSSEYVESPRTFYSRARTPRSPSPSPSPICPGMGMGVPSPICRGHRSPRLRSDLPESGIKLSTVEYCLVLILLVVYS